MHRIVIFATLLLGACGLVATEINQSRINKLQIGMTRSEAIAVMGSPNKREAYGDTEFLIYRTEIEGPEHLTLTPIAIVRGKVAGWGRNYYESAIKADVTIKTR
jgi:hypothetical protein